MHHVLHVELTLRLFDRRLLRPLRLPVRSQNGARHGVRLLSEVLGVHRRLGLDRLQLLLQPRDLGFLIRHPVRVVVLLRVEVAVELLHRPRHVLLALYYLVQTVLRHLVAVDLHDQRLEGAALLHLAHGLRQNLDQLGPLLLDLHQVVRDVGVVLQVAAEVLGRLAQRPRDVLNLALHLLVFRFVRQPLQRATLRNQLLVPRLELPLLVDDVRDLVPHELGELVAVLQHVRRDGAEEAELLNRLVEDGDRALRLDGREHHVAHLLRTAAIVLRRRDRQRRRAC
mmetsp:Transcript_18303/g.38387  ORF Transcript_18303/g.38387 Transcript_18303/m.38387 type:complete len:283 (-) Transcript_18303:73-921(-)